MSLNKYEIFDLLYKIASTNKTVFGTRHAACIVYKKSIMSFGVNSYKTHPFQSKYSKHKNCIYLHAETEAIKNAKYKINLDKCKLYVVRVKWNLNNSQIVFGNSKPCNGCMKAISKYSIRKVLYSDDEGRICTIS